jgi:hypothetical protein
MSGCLAWTRSSLSQIKRWSLKSRPPVTAILGPAGTSTSLSARHLAARKSRLVDPAQRAGEVDYAAYQAVHDAVKTGLVRGFFCEAVVTLDAIARKTKSEVLGAARFVSETFSTGPRCLVPGFDGAFFSAEWKEALWGRFTTGAPQRLRQSVERYSIVKRA